MKLTDIIALAKAGYSASDIKELAALELPEAEPTPQPNRTAEPEEQPVTTQEKPKPEEESVAQEAPVRDNKELEEANQKIIDLESKLAAAQKVNTTKDLSGSTVTDADAFANVMRNFM